MKKFSSFITEALSSQSVAKPNPNDDEADMTVAFGRFNPPTTGHEKLMNKVKQVAGKGNYEIYPSRSNDPKKNPLDPETKIGYCLLYTSPSPRDGLLSRMPSSA